MARPKMNNAEKLLRRMKRVGGMTRPQVLKYMNVLTGRGARAPLPAGRYNSTLYGTNKVMGVLEAFCTKNSNGVYKVTRTLKGPFQPRRPQVEIFGLSPIPSVSSYGISDPQL